jgi:hypothetical protein
MRIWFALALTSALFITCFVEPALAQLQGLCPGGHWVPVPAPGGTTGAMCVQDQVAPRQQLSCPSGTSLCGTICCNAGFMCSKFGCVQPGSIDCGTHACGPDQQCGTGQSCLPRGAADCGNGTYCNAGQRCSQNGQYCLGAGDIDCGTYSCQSGNKCSRFGGCISADAIECGTGYCNPGNRCVADKCVRSQTATILDRISQFFSARGDMVTNAIPLISDQLARVKLGSGEQLSSALNGQPQSTPWQPLPAGFLNDPFSQSKPAQQGGAPTDPFTGMPIATGVPATIGSPQAANSLPPPGQLNDQPTGCSVNPTTYQFVCASTF